MATELEIFETETILGRYSDPNGLQQIIISFDWKRNCMNLWKPEMDGTYTSTDTKKIKYPSSDLDHIQIWADDWFDELFK